MSRTLHPRTLGFTFTQQEEHERQRMEQTPLDTAGVVEALKIAREEAELVANLRKGNAEATPASAPATSV